MRKTLALILTLGISGSSVLPIRAQDPAPQQPSAEEVEKQAAELKKNAYRLLDQVIDESQSLRLPENRVRIQINTGDLLWASNQERARSLFTMASDAVIEMIRNANSTASTGNQRPNQNQDRRWISLRQELVLAAARHDVHLAYQLLAATRNPAPPQTQSTDPRNPRIQVPSDESLEQTLLGRIAELDPKLAAQNAEQMMEKGQFPRTMGEVLKQLHTKDPEAAAKLADKTVKRIQASNILTNAEANALAVNLIVPGPRTQAAEQPVTATPANATSVPQRQGRPPVLELSQYTDLMSTVIDAALKATPQQNAQRSQNVAGQRGGGGPAGPNRTGTPNPPAQPSESQAEQNGARRLLNNLQSLLPAIDLYLPGRSSAVRQKLTEMGMSDPNRSSMTQAMNALLQQGNADAESLVRVAASAPPQLQSRIYQQAASKALEEGNTDRARQIATDHLQASARDSMIQRISFREMARKADGARLDEIRQNLSRLTSETEKVSLLLQIAEDLKKENPKAQRQVLEEARQIVNHRANSYAQFEDQLRVARAFTSVDPNRSFEVIEPAIMQLNELLAAAAVLSGFEVNVFREGEMNLMPGGSGLSSTINRFGLELAGLAKHDFERAEMLAGRFQFAEPRIMMRLTIIQRSLGVNSSAPQNFNVIRDLMGGNSIVVRP